MKIADRNPLSADDLTLSLRTLIARSELLVEGFKRVEARLRAAGKDEAADVVARQIAHYELFQDVDLTEMSHREVEDYFLFMAGRLEGPPNVAVQPSRPAHSGHGSREIGDKSGAEGI